MLKKNLRTLKRNYYSKFDRSNFICLDANERPFEFNNKEIKKINQIINSKNYTKYPKYITKIINQISKREKIKNNMISIHPGIDGCLKAIFENFQMKRKIQLNSISPTYGMISVYSKMFNFKLNNIIENYNLVKKIFSRNPSIIYIANPNSPSGNLISYNDLIKIFKICERKKIFLIIDEAYIDFSKQKSFVSEVKKSKFLIVLKSYSKSFGLPGIRVGYMVSNSKNIDNFGKLRSIYDVSSLSLAVINYFEQNYKIVENYLQLIKENKIFIEKICIKLKIKYRITHGNFFYLTFKKNLTYKIFKFLKKNKILVKLVNDNNLKKNESSIRVTIGTIFQIRNLFNKIKKIKGNL